MKYLIYLTALCSTLAYSANWEVEGDRAESNRKQNRTYASLYQVGWGENNISGLSVHFYGHIKDTSPEALRFCPNVIRVKDDEFFLPDYTDARIKIGGHYYFMQITCSKSFDYRNAVSINATPKNWGENKSLLQAMVKSNSLYFLTTNISMIGFTNAVKELEYIHRVPDYQSVLN